MKETDHHLHQ